VGESAPQIATEPLEPVTIGSAECRWHVGVDVQHPQQAAARRDDGDDELGAGRRRARDVPGEALHVVDALRGSSPGRGAAHTAIERDAQAAVPALIRADHQELGGDGPIEAGPVVVGEGAMELTADRRHGRNPVVLLRQQRLDDSEHLGIPRGAFIVVGVQG
jgi:hypothetical protein